MHRRFRESKIHGCDATTEGPQGKPNKVISSCYARKCEKRGSSWQMKKKTTKKQGMETGLETFLKVQIAVSEVFG